MESCPGTMIADRYCVIREAGAGNFAKVYVCSDNRNDNCLVAVKLLKKEFEQDAGFERDVLMTIGKKDPDHQCNVVKMLSYFKWKDQSCFVFTLKGIPLKNKLSSSHGSRVSRDEVAVIAKDLAKAMCFLHKQAKIIHTDLKPENILLDEGSNVPHKWVVCDLGSASFIQERFDSDLISTRPYRAPEVVVGSAWTAPVDMWSIGCILYEAYTGEKLFDIMTDEAHLGLMEVHLGPIPEKVLRNGNPRQIRQMFSSDMKVRNNPYPSRVRSMREVLKEDPQFHDLVSSLLTYDPSLRLKAHDMVAHPFINRVQGSSNHQQPRGTSEISHQRNYPSGVMQQVSPVVQRVLSTPNLPRQKPFVPVTPTAYHSMGESNNNNMDAQRNIARSVNPSPPQMMGYSSAHGPKVVSESSNRSSDVNGMRENLPPQVVVMKKNISPMVGDMTPSSMYRPYCPPNGGSRPIVSPSNPGTKGCANYATKPGFSTQGGAGSTWPYPQAASKAPSMNNNNVAEVVQHITERLANVGIYNSQSNYTPRQYQKSNYPYMISHGAGGTGKKISPENPSRFVPGNSNASPHLPYEYSNSVRH